MLVTGATGTLGRKVVGAATAAGHHVRAMSRRSHVGYTGVHWAQGDLLTGAGVDAAVDGIDVIVHCATQGTRDKDVTSTKTSSRRRAGPASRTSSMCRSSASTGFRCRTTRPSCASSARWTPRAVGHTVLRATQFHDLIKTIFSIQRFSPLLWTLRGVRFQPIDTHDVAARLVELIDTEPAGRVADIGGPSVHTHAELARMYLAAAAAVGRSSSCRCPGRIVGGFGQARTSRRTTRSAPSTSPDYLAENE